MSDTSYVEQTVGVITNVSKENAAEATRQVCGVLDQYGVPWQLERDTADCIGAPDGLLLDQLLQQAEWLIIIGGDGTILAIAPQAATHGRPILGVNPGRSVGFLTDVMVDEFESALKTLQQHAHTVVKRATLACMVESGSHLASYTALNDVTFTHGAQARLIALDVRVNDEYLTTYAADGLIVASATGSTAHSLSAGGPVLFPSTEALIVTPVCPHTLSNRPMILPRSHAIDVRIADPVREVHVAVDGQVAHRLEPHERIVVELGAAKVTFLHTTQRSFCQVLRQKLYWRGGLRSDQRETD